MSNFLYFSIFTLSLLGCGESKQISPAEKQLQIENSKKISQAHSKALQLAERNEPDGFLKLYEIATDCDTYTVEYCEVAYDSISKLLFTNNRTWVKTFANVEQEKFRKFFYGVNDADDLLSSIKMVSEIIVKLEKFKGNQRETELVDFLKSILVPHHNELLKCAKQNCWA